MACHHSARPEPERLKALTVELTSLSPYNRARSIRLKGSHRMDSNSTHYIVFGNEKGGTGKSTLAMHVVVCLQRLGYRVAVIDLDSRQKTVSRFLENRHKTIAKSGDPLPIAQFTTLPGSSRSSTAEQRAEEQQALQAAINSLSGPHDVIVIDCPGSHTHLSSLAHALADTLITPMNDSFIDMDLLGEVNPDTWKVDRLSHYAEMVWQSRKFRSASERPPMDWVVTRNRLANLHSQNTKRVDEVLTALQKRLFFRYVPGLSERVIYRELFPRGLTMMDIDLLSEFGRMQVSHVAARREVKQLVEAMKLPDPSD